MADLRIWQVILWDITCAVAAETRGRARYLVARAAADAGYGTVGEGLVRMRCRRAPDADWMAGEHGREGVIPLCPPYYPPEVYRG